MAMIAQEWELDVERGPDSLYVRPRSTGRSDCDWTTMAEQILEVMKQNFAHRLVLELDAVTKLTPGLLEQLIRVQKCMVDCGGMVRITGLTPECMAALRANRAEERFPCYATRAQAVMNREV